jgi:opacity protein-like surface antigen
MRPKRLYLLFNIGKLNNNGKNSINLEYGIYNKTSFTLNTTNNLGNNIIITGKTAPLITFSYSVAYNLLGKPDDEKKISPYLKLGILGLVKMGEETVSSGTSYFFEDAPGFGAFIKGGAGTIYKINSRFDAKLEGNYNYFIKTSPEEIAKNALYNKSHINLTVGVRYSFGDAGE